MPCMEFKEFFFNMESKHFIEFKLSIDDNVASLRTRSNNLNMKIRNQKIYSFKKYFFETL